MAQSVGAGPRARCACRSAQPERGGHILSLGTAARQVLETAAPAAKIKRARKVARDWRAGRLEWRFDVPMPDRPTRGDHPQLLPPNRMPRRGKGGTVANRIALLHAIAHIEYVAIDLAFDMVGRFGGAFPRSFADDWIQVGAEEAMHFALVDRRLRQLGSHYGAMAAHDGLWDAAGQTAHDPIARLAIVPMVLEARGLDVTPQMIERFDAVGDRASSSILGRILRDEIKHVAAGVRWFEGASLNRSDSASAAWRDLVATHFRAGLKPPFNDSARAAAGLTTDYYEAVAEVHACRPEKFPSSREGQISRRTA